ncbi:MAG: sigma-54-dependent transcriptional regulator [Spirochaetaceae bacterium]
MSTDTPTRPSVLVVDDDYVALERYRTVLEARDLAHYIMCEDSREVPRLLRERNVGVVLLDLNMPHLRGEDLLADMSSRYPDIPVVVLTAADDVDTAVKCMKLGAFDYMTKPVDPNRLVNAVSHALRIRDLQTEVQVLSANEAETTVSRPDAFKEILTKSPTMRKLMSYAETIAPSPKVVLITGESGTGKELMAQAVHRVSGRSGEFVAVNVSGLDETMFSDTLFGHVKGAFTGAETARPGLIERAAGGTLFLDEIGDLEPGAQVKLLRLLQEQEYYPLGSDRPRRSGARVITATNADLAARRREGGFRNDLFYRLIGHRIDIPPLRSRPEDIPVLLDHFLKESAEALGRPVPAVPRGLVGLLSSYDFPGNVRELQAMIYDAVSSSPAGTISIQRIRDYLDGRDGHEGGSTDTAHPSVYEEEEASPPISFSGRLPTLQEAEDYLVAEALERAEGNQSVAARMLGVSQSTLSRRLRK